MRRLICAHKALIKAPAAAFAFGPRFLQNARRVIQYNKHQKIAYIKYHVSLLSHWNVKGRICSGNEWDFRNALSAECWAWCAQHNIYRLRFYMHTFGTFDRLLNRLCFELIKNNTKRGNTHNVNKSNEWIQVDNQLIGETIL